MNNLLLLSVIPPPAFLLWLKILTHSHILDFVGKPEAQSSCPKRITKQIFSLQRRHSVLCAVTEIK